MRHSLTMLCLLAVLCFTSTFVRSQSPFPCKTSTSNKNCLTIGPQSPGTPQGWMVGEIKTFAVGADSTDLINQLAAQGWVEAAGQSAIRKDFDELWKIMGTDWGSADKTNVFFLPDLRGLMLRAWQHRKTAPEGHPESPYAGEPNQLASTRVPPRPEIADNVGSKGSAGNQVGSLEADQVGPHAHNYVRYESVYHLANDDHTSQIFWGGSTSVPTDPSAGTETHPINAYVMYFIYVGKPAQVIEPSTANASTPGKNTGEIRCYKAANGTCKTKL